MTTAPAVGLLWRREWDPPETDPPEPAMCKLHGVFEAFAALGVRAQPVVYSDDDRETTREQLSRLDGVLVWVNPIEQGLDRAQLDPLLRDVGEEGVWVSAHPDVITRMATKRVLYDTREMSWGTDVRLHTSTGQLQEELAERLADGAPRVLKQLRGMGGQGVWRVQEEHRTADPLITVRQALRDAPVERMRLSDFAASCARYFDRDGVMVEQPFQERIDEGMIRVYLTHDEVVGFAHQFPIGLRPQGAGAPPPGKRFEEATAPAFGDLRERVEREWLPELRRILDLDRGQLPVIWDIDLLHGATKESYVLCEINASSTFAFPEHAMPHVAEAALARICASGDGGSPQRG